MSDFASKIAMQQLEPSECCGGTCRLAAIARMSRSELMNAVVDAEMALSMAEDYIDELEDADTLT